MVIQIKNKQLAKALAKENLSYIKLYRDADNGIHFISTDDEAHFNEVYGLKTTAIYVGRFNQMTITEWVNEIKTLLNNK